MGPIPKRNQRRAEAQCRTDICTVPGDHGRVLAREHVAKVEVCNELHYFRSTPSISHNTSLSGRVVSPPRRSASSVAVHSSGLHLRTGGERLFTASFRFRFGRHLQKKRTPKKGATLPAHCVDPGSASLSKLAGTTYCLSQIPPPYVGSTLAWPAIGDDRDSHHEIMM